MKNQSVEKQEPEVIESEPQSPQAISLPSTEIKGQMIPIDRVEAIIDLADQSERLMAALKKIKQQVLSLTNEKDWVDENGQPYLQGSGCQKLARFYGVSWRFLDTEPRKVPTSDGHYRYDVRVAFWKNEDYIEYIGARESSDPFFTTYYEYDQKEGKKVRKHRHPREIDSGNVLKAAITNAMQGILAFLGMKRLTWEDLAAGGLNTEKIRKEASVKYDSKKEEKPAPQAKQHGPASDQGNVELNKKSAAPSPEKKEPEPDNPIRAYLPQGGQQATEKQQTAITNIFKKSRETLGDVTERLFKERISTPQILTMKEASAVIKFKSDQMNGQKEK